MEPKNPLNQPTSLPTTKTPETKTGVVFEPEYFDIQLQFAKTVAEKTGKEFTEVLIEYTDFYRRFGLGHKVNRENPRWKEFIEGINQGKDPVSLSYNFYLNQPEKMPENITPETFGSLKYDYVDGTIFIHFINRGEDTSLDTDSFRKDSLAMFESIKAKHPEAKKVYAKSWLLGTTLVKSILPESVLKDIKIEKDKFQSASRWGQFVDRNGKIKTKIRDKFVADLRGVDINNLSDIFPRQTYEVEGDINEFYKALGITDVEK